MLLFTDCIVFSSMAVPPLTALGPYGGICELGPTLCLYAQRCSTHLMYMYTPPVCKCPLAKSLQVALLGHRACRFDSEVLEVIWRRVRVSPTALATPCIQRLCCIALFWSGPER